MPEIKNVYENLHKMQTAQNTTSGIKQSVSYYNIIKIYIVDCYLQWTLKRIRHFLQRPNGIVIKFIEEISFSPYIPQAIGRANVI